MLVQIIRRFIMGHSEALVRPMVLYSAGRTTSYPEDTPEKGLRYHPLGGGDEVGNVGIMFENDKQTKLLLNTHLLLPSKNFFVNFRRKLRRN